jgi:hypothetical protein
VTRAAATRARWFQRVTVALPGPLYVYDFTPPEMIATVDGKLPTRCPYLYGFAMIAAAPSPPPAACTGGTQPASGRADAGEILVGTDFYASFTVSSDCRCTAQYHAAELTAASTLGGALSGILVYDVPYAGHSGYQYIAPQSASDAPIAGVTQR